MRHLDGKTAVVIGGSQGIGQGIVGALAGEGASVWALGRDTERLAQIKQTMAGVQTLVGDVTDPQMASQIVRATRPQILVLSAGATPVMAPLHQQSWEQFGRTWETDVHMTFSFGKEALLAPLPPGSVVVIISSGAAIGGSSLSGAYAGAKRTQWFLAHYLQEESDALQLGIRFVALLPKQIMNSTALGHTAAVAYAARQGISEQTFIERFGPPLTPADVGQGVVSLLTDQAYSNGVAFGISSQGLAAL